jgi:hypothetical protein
MKTHSIQEEIAGRPGKPATTQEVSGKVAALQRRASPVRTYRKTLAALAALCEQLEPDAPLEVSAQSLSPEGSESPIRTTKKYLQLLGQDLELEVDVSTGLVLQPTRLDESNTSARFEWVEPKCSAPNGHLTAAEVKRLSERIKPKALVDCSEASFPRDQVMTAIAHIDGALWPFRPGPTMHECGVAKAKMQEAPDTYTLLITDEDADRFGGGATGRIHGYTSFWRTPARGGPELLADCLETGNLRSSRSQAEWAPSRPRFVQPQLLDAVFTSVQLAPYLRPSRDSSVVRRPWLFDAIVDSIARDAERNIYYRSVFFRLTHEDEGKYIREHPLCEGRAKWLTRRSTRELLVQLDLLSSTKAWPEAHGELRRVVEKYGVVAKSLM